MDVTVYLTTFNSKFIHVNLALRWLYVANKTDFSIQFKEFTIKDSIQKTAEEIVASGSTVVGIGVYIWNVEHSRLLAAAIKKLSPQIIIILGGPEVSYEPKHFIDAWDIDYVISGEGEFVLNELLHALRLSLPTIISGVSSKTHTNSIIAKADIEKLILCDSPYELMAHEEHIAHKVAYFESSRGCPYQCQYCLSSLEKGVRYFPLSYITKNLNTLITSQARLIKFLDRTFNLNKEHTQAIFSYILQNYNKNLRFQFEIYADLLDSESILYLNTHAPKDYLRFEIGIQSTYEPANIAVQRRQDFSLIAHNVKQLIDANKIVLHLDLIAGLPYESYERFIQSFNDVFHLKAQELQLGFLKLLRGTNLRTYSHKYGYRYSAEAPYEIIDNAYISEEELNSIRQVEHTLDIFWNSGRFSKTMNKLIHHEYKHKYFEFFSSVADYMNALQFPKKSYSLEDLFYTLHSFLLTQSIDASPNLRDDYYSNFEIRPHGYWHADIDKHSRRKLLYTIGQDTEFLNRYGLTRYNIEKQTAINTLTPNTYILTIFTDGRKKTDTLHQIVYTVNHTHIQNPKE